MHNAHKCNFAQACLEGCIKIERLVLRGCDKLTDRSIVDVSKYLPHLMALDVSACDQVTAAGLAPLGKLHLKK